MAYKGIGYLRRKLKMKRTRVLERYNYYEMKKKVRDFGISTPPGLLLYSNTLGWCEKAVDSIADRLVLRGFAEDNFDFAQIFQMNNPDTLFDSAMLSALIASCSFVYISKDEEGFPRLQVIDGANATGIKDEITGLLSEGYAVLERDEKGNPSLEAYFTAEYTTYYGGIYGPKGYSIPNPAPYPLLVPIIYKPDAKREFGHSRISRACMDIQSSAVRTVKRSEISAEFYSFPQKYAVGTSQDAEPMEKWRASMSAMLEITKDQDGDKPTLGQFQQQSMAPHLDQLRSFAALFAGETGLTVDDLGFVSDNPSSQEAIKASHENLRLKARKAQRDFSSGFVNVGYLAACVRDDFPYRRNQIYRTKVLWEPIFEPDASMLSSIGDGVIKINQSVPGYIGKDTLRDLTGIDASQEPVMMQAGDE